MNPATPRQVAYLKFLGYADATTYTKAQASQIIESTGNDPALNEKIWEWKRYRFYAYPELYAGERDEEIESLKDELHAYVRNRMVGASERLTKEKIADVLQAISKENYYWWLDEHRKEIFYSALARLYPGCVDGRERVPARVNDSEVDSTSVVSEQVSQRDRSEPKGIGCLALLITLVILSASYLVLIQV